jgi:hypothetical protein
MADVARLSLTLPLALAQIGNRSLWFVLGRSNRSWSLWRPRNNTRTRLLRLTQMFIVSWQVGKLAPVVAAGIMCRYQDFEWSTQEKWDIDPSGSYLRQLLVDEGWIALLHHYRFRVLFLCHRWRSSFCEQNIRTSSLRS